MLKLVSLLTIFLFLKAQAYRDPIRLTHGPMLGKPTSSSVAVWGRTSEPGEFIVKFGTKPSQSTHSSLPAKTEIDRDNTGVANLTGLKGDTRYYYQIFVKDNPHGLPGTFLTIP